MKADWVPHDTRDEVIDTVNHYAAMTSISAKRFIAWIGISRSKFFNWRERYGKVNEHNALVPRDHWIEPWERQAIIKYYADHMTDGYRRITFMMLDESIVAVSPSTAYRVLSHAGLLKRFNAGVSNKGKGFEQPLVPHQHWHIDISYLNIRGTFFFLCDIIDGASRSIVQWDIREQMREADVEIVLQKAHELYPDAKPRIISDNGPQFIARDFKEYIRIRGMTHVRTSPYYPQSNGKIERFHQTLKGECIRQKTPLSLDGAKSVVSGYIDYYNNQRLHSAIGYITPKDKLMGRADEIHRERDRKLEAARELRKLKRRQQRHQYSTNLTDNRAYAILPIVGETDAGNAGEQPARDSRQDNRRKAVGEGIVFIPSDPPSGIPEIFPMPQKTQYNNSLNPKLEMSKSR